MSSSHSCSVYPGTWTGTSHDWFVISLKRCRPHAAWWSFQHCPWLVIEVVTSLPFVLRGGVNASFAIECSKDYYNTCRFFRKAQHKWNFVCRFQTAWNISRQCRNANLETCSPVNIRNTDLDKLWFTNNCFTIINSIAPFHLASLPPTSSFTQGNSYSLPTTATMVW